MKVVMSPSAASISTSGRSNFSEACLWNPSREALNKADLGSARVTPIIRATSAMKAEQESRKSHRRATKLFLTSSSTISWTRENSAMRVPANVLSSSRICPKSAMDRSWRAWAWSRMERAIRRVRSLLGAASALPTPLPESLEGNAPVSVGFEAACSHSHLYSSMVEGNTVSNTMVQWS